MANAVTANGAAVNRVQSAPQRPRSFGDWAVCVRKATMSRTSPDERRAAMERLDKVYGSAPVEKAAMAETSGQVGGYLVPLQYGYGLMKSMAEHSIFWPRAFVQPMASKTAFLPLPDPTGSIGTKQVSNLFGGMQLSWTSAQSATETEPKFLSVELNANELTGYLLIANQLFDDYDSLGAGGFSSALEGVGVLSTEVFGAHPPIEDQATPTGRAGLGGFLTKFIGEAVAWFSDQAFFRGIGVGQPQGLIGAGATIVQNRTTANSVVQADLAALDKQLLPGCHRSAVWAWSPTANEKIANLSGMGGILYYLPGDDGSQGLLYGKPFYVTEKLPDVGTLGDVLLFDPTKYAIGFRDLQIDFSEHNKFTTNQTVCRVVARLDGAPALQSSVTLANQSSTKASAYVALQ